MKSIANKLLKVVAPIVLVLFAGVGCLCLSQTNVVAQTTVQQETQISQTQTVESEDEVVLGLEKWEDYAEETSYSGTTLTSFTTQENFIIYGKTISGYPIRSAANLAYFAKQVNSGNQTFFQANIILLADIDLSGKIWTPIGIGGSSTYQTFAGYFYGNGHKITGITIDSTITNVTGSAQGLFGTCDGYIYDLVVEDSYFSRSTGRDIVGWSSADQYCQGVFCCYGSSYGKRYYYGKNFTDYMSDYSRQFVYFVQVNGNTYSERFSKDSADGTIEIEKFLGTNETITNIYIYEYVCTKTVSDRYALIKQISIEDKDQTKSYSKLTLNRKHGISGISNYDINVDASGETGEITINANYTHQRVIRIIIDTENKYVEQKINFYSLDATNRSGKTGKLFNSNPVGSVETAYYIKDSDLSNLYNGDADNDLLSSGNYFTPIAEPKYSVSSGSSYNANGKYYFRYDSDLIISMEEYLQYSTGFYFIMGDANNLFQEVQEDDINTIWVYATGDPIDIYIINMQQITIKNKVKYDNSDCFNVTNEAVTAYRITDITGSGDTAYNKIIFDNYGFDELSMIDLKLLSSDNDCLNIHNAGERQEANTNIKWLEFSEIADKGEYYAWWYVLPTEVSLKLDASMNSNDLDMKYFIYRPYKENYVEITNIQDGSKIVELYYTDVLWIYDQNSVTKESRISYYFTATSTGKSDASNKIERAIDFEYKGAGETLALSKSGSIGYDDPSIVYTAGIKIKCLSDTSANDFIEYTLTKQAKRVGDVYLAVKENGNDAVLNSAEIKEKLGLSSLCFGDGDNYSDVLSGYNLSSDGNGFDISGLATGLMAGSKSVISWGKETGNEKQLKATLSVSSDDDAIVISIINPNNIAELNKQISFTIQSIATSGKALYLTLSFDVTENTITFNAVDDDNLNNNFNSDEIKVKTKTGDTTYTTYTYNKGDNLNLNAGENTINLQYLYVADLENDISVYSYEFFYNSDNGDFTINSNNRIEVSDFTFVTSSENEYVLSVATTNYYPGGIYVELHVKEIEYALKIDVTNGALVDSQNALTLESLKEEGVKFRYNDNIEIELNGVSLNVCIKSSKDAEGNFATKYNFTINPKNNSYELIKNDLLSGEQTRANVTGKTIVGDGNDIKNDIKEIVYQKKVYTINGSIVANGETEKVISSFTKTTTKGNLLLSDCEILDNQLYNLDKILIQKDETSWEQIDVITDNQLNYVIFDSNINVNKQNILLIGSGDYFISSGGVNIKFVYTPIEYSLTFKGGLENNKTYTTTVTVLSEQTLSGVLGDNLDVKGYRVSGFKIETNSYSLNMEISQLLKQKKSAEKSIELVVTYEGKNVLLYFIDTEDNSTIKTLSGVFGTEYNLTEELKTTKKDGYVLSMVKIGNADEVKYSTEETYLFNNFDYISGATTYEILLTFAYNSINVIFDDTYTTSTITTTVEYDTVAYTQVPTPSRNGFDFVHWKAVDSKNNEFYIYLSGESVDSPKTTICDTIDESLTFYAYWNIDDAFIDCVGDAEVEYNAQTQTVLVAKFNRMDGLTNKIVVQRDVAQNGNYQNSASNLYTIETVGSEILVSVFVKYVTDSAKFKLTYSYEYDAETGASGSDFVLSSLKQDIVKEFGITITPKKLTIEAINKVYDGTTTVLQNVSGICDADVDFAVEANYQDANAGAEKTIIYSNNNQELALNYEMPQATTGTITTLKFTVTIQSGSHSIYNANLSEVKVASVEISKDGIKNIGTKSWIVEIDGANVVVNNNDAWSTLKQNTVLSFDIVTSENSTGVFSANGEKKLVVTNFEGDSLQNIEIEILGNYSITDLDENQKGFKIIAQKEDTEQYVEIKTLDSYYLNEFANNQLILIKEDCYTGDEVVLNLLFVNVENYWIKQVSINNIPTNSYTTLENGYAITVNVDDVNWYEISIILTRTSDIIFDYSLPSGELLDGNSYREIQVNYGDTFENISLNREGFTFAGWSLDCLGQTTFVDGNKWTLKQNKVVLYAVWSYNANSTVNGVNIEKTYDGTTTSVAPVFAKNTYVNNQIVWKKSTDKQKWTNVNSELLNGNLLKIKNVADNGYYGFTLKVSASVEIWMVNAFGEFEKTTQTIAYHGENTIPYQQFAVNIQQKTLNLTNAINKIYDATNVMQYTLTAEDVVGGVCENDVLQGEMVTITYASANFESTIVSIVGTNDVALNYNFTGSGKILKRNLTLDIGEKTVSYTGGYPNVQVEKVIDYNSAEYVPVYISSVSNNVKSLAIENVEFVFNSLYVQSLGYNVGVYSGNNLKVFAGIVDSFGNSVNIDNFNVSVIGSIEISNAVIGDNEVVINTQKTYNAELQTITYDDIKISGVSLQEFDNGSADLQVFENNIAFTGKKDVGEYSLKVVITTSNFAQFETTVTFTIQTLIVTIEQVETFAKSYDATTEAKLVLGTNYSCISYLSVAGKEPAGLNKTLINAEIGENFNYVYADKNVGNDIKIGVVSDDEYKNIELVLSGQFKGDIKRVDAKISIGSIEQQYSNENIYSIGYNNLTVYINNQPSTINESIISGNLAIYKSLFAGTKYNASSFEASEWSVANLSVTGSVNISKNYNIVGIIGNITINKANVSVELIKDTFYTGIGIGYIYTGRVVDLKYRVSISANGKETTKNYTDANISEFITVIADGVDVGRYTATFDLLDTNNYQFINNTNSCEYFIAQQTVNITINQSKLYDGKVFEFNVNDGTISGLNNGHYISSQAKITTRWVNVREYNTALSDEVVYSNIDIYDDKNNLVTSNYNIVFSGVLTIAKALAVVEDVEPPTYNGETHRLSLNIAVNNDTLIEVVYSQSLAHDVYEWRANNTGKTYVDYIKVNPQRDSSGNILPLVILFNVQTDSSGNETYYQDEGGTEFKYAGNYRAEIYSLDFDMVSINLKILPKEINSKDIANYSADKRYDGTKTILVNDGGFKYSNGESIFFNKGNINDADYIYLTAQYSSVFGTNLPISFTLNKNGSAGNTLLADRIFDSYKIVNVSSVIGNISERKVIFKYIGTNTYYYTGTNLELNFATNFDALDEDGTQFALAEDFTSTIGLPTLVNASSTAYNLAEVSSINFGNLVVTSELKYYSISLSGEIKINKAVVNSNVSNLIYTYNAKGHTATLIASIVDGKGAIIDGNEGKILTAKYGTDNIVECVNAGEYEIKPEISTEFAGNYELSTNQVSKKLTINRVNLSININKSIYFVKLVGKTCWEIDLSQEIISGLLDGQTISGFAKTTNNIVDVYTTQANTVVLENIAIKSGEVDVTSNYNISYDITLTISDQLSADEFCIEADPTVYNGTNQKDTINFVGISKTESDVIEVAQKQFYEDVNHQRTTTNVVNAGTYYALVYYTINGSDEILYPYVVEVLVSPKTITSYMLTDNATEFNGAKVYDGSSEVELSQKDICNADLSKIASLKAKYFDISGSETSFVNNAKSISIELETVSGYEYLKNNYIFEAPLNFTIKPREISLGLNPTYAKQYTYAGEHIISITQNDMTLVSGSFATGEVLSEYLLEITLNNVGRYGLKNVSPTKSPIIVKAGTNVTQNYAITITGEVTVEQLMVQVSYNGGNLIYNAFDRKDDIKDLLTYNFTLESYAQVSKESIIASVKNDLTLFDGITVKDVVVGGYTLTAKVKNGSNFNVVVGANNVVVIESASINIDFTDKVFDYAKYTKQNGYIVDFADISGVNINTYNKDISYFNSIKFAVKETPAQSNKVYTYNANTEQSEITLNYDNANSNYKIVSIVGTLNLYAGDVQIDIATLVYNGELRTLTGSVTFEGNTTQVDCDSTKDMYFTILKFNDVESENIEYKYAGKYLIQLLSNTGSFGPQTQTAVIKATTITSVSGYQTTKQYDGTTNVMGNIVCDGIYENDKAYIEISGAYAKEFGTSNIKFTSKMLSSGKTAEKVYNSYIVNIDEVVGEITAREVTFTFNSAKAPKLYYTAKETSLSVEYFDITNQLASEPFSGSVTFNNGLVNADTYNLNTVSQECLVKTQFNLTSGNIGYYDITYAGNVVINQAVVHIAQVENYQVTYDSLVKGVTLVAEISDNKGKLLNNEKSVLYATYKDANQNTINSPINAGIYDIIVNIADTNYTFDNSQFENNQLIIARREYKIVVEKEYAFDPEYEYLGYYSYNLGNLDVPYEVNTGVHSLNGSLRTVGYSKGEFSLSAKTVIVYNLTIGGVVAYSNGIKDDNSLVFNNYDLTIEAKLTFGDNYGDGEAVVVQKQPLTYNGQNQINSIVLEMTVGGNNQTTTKTISSTSEEFAGVYAKDKLTKLSEVKNQGTYYAYVHLVTSTINEFRFVTVKIVAKEITTYINAETNEEFTGTKVYDASETLKLKSNDVCVGDSIEIIAYYTSKNVKATITQITINNDTYGNYIAKMPASGSIIERAIQIDLKNSVTYSYQGSVTETISGTMFEVVGTLPLLKDHTLLGEISLRLSNVGKYYINSLNGIYVANKTTGEADNNYAVTIVDDAYVQVEKLNVEIEWTDNTLVYSGKDLKQEFINNVSCISAFEKEIKQCLSNHFDELIAIKLNDEQVNSIINVGTYSLEIVSSSVDNINFVFSIKSGKNTLNITKNSLNINFVGTVIDYLDYKNSSGVVMSSDNVTGVFGVDKQYIPYITFNIVPQIVLDSKYSYNDDATLTQITYTAPFNLSQNYNFIIQGDITVVASKEIMVNNPTYAGKTADLIDEIVVLYDGNDCSVTKINSGKITFVGTDYYVYAEIDTDIYAKVKIEVQPKILDNVLYQADKQYDGTNVVFNSDNNEKLKVDGVSGDDIYAKGTYQGIVAGRYSIEFKLYGEQERNYKLQLAGAVGDITEKIVIVNVGDLVYTYNQSNEYTHNYTQTLDLATGDSLKENANKLTFVYNEIVQYCSIENITTSNFEVTNSQFDVTSSYKFKFVGTITINARKFKVVLSNNSNLTYNTLAKDVTVTIQEDDVLSETEKQALLQQVVLSYTYPNGQTLSFAPKDVGLYTATATFVDGNYKMTSANTLSFEVVPFEFTLDKSEVQDFVVNEDNIETEILSQGIVVQIDDDVSERIVVTFQNVDSNNNIGYHNIKVAQWNTSNVKVISTEYANKLYITASAVKQLSITLTSYKNGNFETYYGKSNLGVFDLEDFAYTCKVEDKTLSAEELAVIGLSGDIIFNTGDASETGYGIQTYRLTSAYVNMCVQTDLKLIINKRTINVSLKEGQSYNKEFDGTNKFVAEFNAFADETLATYDMLLPNIMFVYSDVNVGNRSIITVVDSNFEVVLTDNASKTAQITKKLVNVEIDEQFMYGELVAQDGEVDILNKTTFKDSNNLIVENFKTYASIKLLVGNEKLSTSGCLKVGEYTIVCSSQNLNLNLSQASVEVVKKDIQFEIVDSLGNKKQISKIQDLNNVIALQSGEQMKLVGLVENDIVNISSAVYSTTDIGENIAINVVLDGVDKGNYNLLQTYGTIRQKDITILFNYFGENSPMPNETTTGTTGDSFNYYAVANLIPSASHNNNGYIFMGWSLSNGGTQAIDFTKALNEIFTTYTESVTVYAIWQVQSFNVTLKRYGFDFNTSTYVQDTTYVADVITKTYGDSIDISQIVTAYEHHNYVGYAEEKVSQIIKSNTYTVVKNVELLLVYDLNKYTITFESDTVFANRNASVFEYTNAYKTASIKGYYGQKLGQVLSSISTYLTLSKAGYSFNGYKLGTQIKQADEFANLTVSGNQTYVAQFTANTYTLTLNAGDGEFKLTDQDITNGWQYVDVNHKKVKASVTYNTTLPQVVNSEKQYYTFVGYILNGKQFEYQGSYTYAEDIELTATYVDKSYKLTVNAQNAINIEVKYYVNNVYSNIKTQSVVDGQANIFDVLTSNKVEIKVTSKDGYSVAGYTATKGVQSGNAFVIDNFVGGDLVVNVNIVANDNEVKLTINDTALGYLEYNSSKTSAGTSTLKFKAKTDSSFTFFAKANEGYEIDEIKFITQKQTVTFTQNTQDNTIEYTISGYVCDVEVVVNIVAKQLQVAFEFENLMVKYNNVIYSQNFTATILANSTISFEFEIMYGYKFKSIEFTPLNSTNKGTLTENVTDNKYSYVLSGITSNGVVKIVQQKQTFDVSIVYGEYDEISQTISLTETPKISLAINGLKQNFNTYSYLYLTDIKLSGVNIANGYKLMGWREYKDEQMLEITEYMVGDDLKFNVNRSLTICLVVMRNSVTIKYTATAGGFVQDNNGINMQEFEEVVFYGRQSQGATAVCEQYTNFEGWYVNDVLYSTECELTPANVSENITYVAKFKGESIVVSIVVKTNNKREELLLTQTHIDNLFTFNGDLVADIQKGIDYQDKQTITAKLEQLFVGDTLSFTLNLPEWFVIKSTSSATYQNNTITIDKIFPTYQQDGVLAYVCNIELIVKTFDVTIKTNISGSVEKIRMYDGVGVLSAKVLDMNEGIALITVEYGGTIDVMFEYTMGYSLKDITYVYTSDVISNSAKFVSNNNRWTMENIKSTVQATLVVEVSRFEVTFEYNYLKGTYPDTAHTYYINYGEQQFTDVNGNPVTLAQSVVNPQSLITDYYTFTGWNNSPSGLGKYMYMFDEQGNIYKLVNGNKVYGFEYDLDRTVTNGAIKVTLYGIWSYDKYRVDVEFAPDLPYESSVKELFAVVTGMFPYYSDDVPKECLYVNFSVGSTVRIFAPAFSGYRYYGWKLKDEANISRTETTFEMPNKAVTVVLYYAFNVSVGVEEPESGINNAYVNDSNSAEVISGQSVQISAVAGRGYKFAYWKVNGEADYTLTQNAVVYPAQSCTYTAVFEAKSVDIEIENDNYTILVANKTQLKLGETLIINVESIALGYELSNITINDVANVFTLSDGGDYYFHIVTVDDVESGKITIRPVSVAKQINVKFVTNYFNSAQIIANNIDVTSAINNYQYGSQLNILVLEDAKYLLEKVTINDVEYQVDNLNDFVLTVLAENNFIIDGLNTVYFEFSKQFWISFAQQFEGLGTQESPYLILTNENLAYMAKVLNSGELDQTSEHLYFKLMADLDLKDKFWEPIGTQDHPFNGTFILNEHTIINATLDPEQQYLVLSWQTKLPNVFGYITDEAELVYKVSKLVIIIIITVSIIIIAGVTITLILVFNKKKKKIEKLSKKISTDTLKKPIKREKRKKEEIKEPQAPSNKLTKKQLKELEKQLDDDLPLNIAVGVEKVENQPNEIDLTGVDFSLKTKKPETNPVEEVSTPLPKKENQVKKAPVKKVPAKKVPAKRVPPKQNKD